MTSPVLNDRRTGVLEAFLIEAVADEYSGVAPSADGRPWFRRHWLAAVGMVAIGALIAVAVVTTQESDDARRQTRAALQDRIATLSTTVGTLQESVDARTAEVDSLREQVLEGSSVDGPFGDVDRLAAQAAATDMTGPGVVVTVDDAPGAAADSLNRVLDRDLQDIVNALWRGGAAAIAVNGQRLTSTTAIRGAGDAVLVNYQPLNRPYTVSAVAGAEGISTDGTRSLLTGLARDYGLVTDLEERDVALTAGEVRSPRFAVVPDGGTTP